MTRNYKNWQILVLSGIDLAALLILAYFAYFVWVIVQVRLYGLPSFDASTILHCLYCSFG